MAVPVRAVRVRRVPVRAAAMCGSRVRRVRDRSVVDVNVGVGMKTVMPGSVQVKTVGAVRVMMAMTTGGSEKGHNKQTGEPENQK